MNIKPKGNSLMLLYAVNIVFYVIYVKSIILLCIHITISQMTRVENGRDIDSYVPPRFLHLSRPISYFRTKNEIGFENRM
jgi:hypothetical protein